MAHVTFIHGIGNKPIESILKCQWDHALFGFDAGARSRLAYWVNREYYPLPTDATCSSGDKVAVEEGPTGRALSVAAHLARSRPIGSSATRWCASRVRSTRKNRRRARGDRTRPACRATSCRCRRPSGAGSPGN